MDMIIDYFSTPESFPNFLTALSVLAAMVICFEKGFCWLQKCFTHLYTRKKGQEEESSTIDRNAAEIQNLANNIDKLATLLNRQYTHLDQKIDEQKERLTLINEAGQKRDCAILRDRILDGMRHLGHNKDADGRVHISVSEHKNMTHLFEAYFNCHGNGTVKAMHDNEFSKWIID